MAKSKEIKLKIEGMSSPCCAEEVKEALLKVKGVKKASVDFKKGIADVEIEPEEVTAKQIIKAVKGAGFKASATEEGAEEIRFETELKELSEKYNIPLKELQDHWNHVKEESAKVFADCCKWCHAHGMREMIDAEAFCKSAIAEGMGEYSIAEQLFKLEKKVKKLTDDEIKKRVKIRYDNFAKEGGYQCPIMIQLAGYSKEELSLVPEIALKLSRGCGNPIRFANIQPGEAILDIGCGGGIDVILAASKEKSGKVIGVDFAPHFIEKANQAVADAGLKDKVELFVGDIEKRLDLPDEFANVAISNCVICLTPNKEAAYREIFRTLKPGGRLAISDIVSEGWIEPQAKEHFQSVWQGPLGGMMPEDDYLYLVKKVGFEQVNVVIRHVLTPIELRTMTCCPGGKLDSPVTEADITAVQGKVVSLKFIAIKPLVKK